VTSTPWDAQGEAQAALRAIVADPQYGPAALSNAQTMTNLLKDMLPDAPRESSVLIAASEAGVPGMLQANVAQGMDWDTASRLAAGSFESRTALTPQACRWAVSVLGSALRLDAATARPGPGPEPDTAPAVPPPPVPPVPPQRPSRIGGLTIAAAATAAAGAILIIWACALTFYAYGFPYRYSLFSLAGGPYGSWWQAIPSVTVAVLAVAAAVLLLVAHAGWPRMLAAGMLLVFGIGTALIWAEQEALYSYDAGPAEIVGMLGGVLLLVAGVLAVAGRKTRAAATSDA
jgi:hypothetical protein